VQVPAAELRIVLDAIGRLQQSTDRMRRQNRRLRLRLQRAGLADDAADTPRDQDEQNDGDPDDGNQHDGDHGGAV
jgi:hypothetical protein